MKLDWTGGGENTRRTLFITAHLAAIAMFFGFVVLPIRAFFADGDARIAEQQIQLARLEGIAAEEASIGAMARQADAEGQQGEFFVGSSEGLISAELQARLKSLVESAGAHLRSAQNLPPKTTGHVKYGGSRVEIYGNIQALRKAVHSIEGARPYLFVASAAMKLALPAGRPNSAEEPTVQMQLDVFAPTQIEGRGR